MKQVVVVGLGQFGSHLARKLVSFGCEVLALDRSETQVNAIRDEVHRALIGDAREPETLKAVITASVDEAVVSLGESMEASILCALHLSQIGVKQIRAKAVNEDHALILRAVGVHEVIFPERETAERTARRVANPHLLDYFPLTEEYRIMDIEVPKRLLGKNMRQSNLRTKHNLLVLAVKSTATGKYNFMPDPDRPFSEDDIVIVLGREVDLAMFSALG